MLAAATDYKQFADFMLISILSIFVDFGQRDDQASVDSRHWILVECLTHKLKTASPTIIFRQIY